MTYSKGYSVLTVIKTTMFTGFIIQSSKMIVYTHTNFPHSHNSQINELFSSLSLAQRHSVINSSAVALLYCTMQSNLQILCTLSFHMLLSVLAPSNSVHVYDPLRKEEQLLKMLTYLLLRISVVQHKLREATQTADEETFFFQVG